VLQIVGIIYKKSIGECGSSFKFVDDDICKMLIVIR